MEVDVLIIGAGISGLAAARWLHNERITVAVLEARDRVGGRTLTKQDSNVGYVDLGGSYVGPTQNHLLRLARDLGIQTYKVNEEEQLVCYQRGSRSLFSRCNMPTFWNPFINMDINNMFYLLDKFGEEIPAEAPWKAPHAEQWDRMTMKDFADKYLWTQTAKDILKATVTLLVASELHDASMLWILWYFKQCYGSKRILFTTQGAQERKFIGGSQLISEKISEELGDRVYLQMPVVKIKQNSKDVEVTTLDGQLFKAKYVISAVPAPLLLKIHFDPPLPSIKNQLIQRQPIGSVMKSIVYYSEPFWREKGLCGSSFIIDDDNHPISFTLDDSKPDGTYPAIVGFIVANKARRLVSLPREMRLNKICESFVKVFGSDKALLPVHYEEMNWMEEQYSGGCYTSAYSPGCLSSFGRILREPFQRLYFAGTETATQWSGYMDGAVSAGERAAREVLCTMGRIPIDDVWRNEPEDKDIPEVPFETTFSEKYLPSVTRFLQSLGGFTVLSSILMFVLITKKKLL